MRKPYPSDISREQFKWISADIKESRKQTRPMEYDLYDIFCAILYVLKQGCTWRALPHDFPPWETVYYHFSRWSKKDEDGKSLLDRLLVKMVRLERQCADGREPWTTMVIVDSKTIDNTDTAEEKGFDGGKKNVGN